MAKQNTKPFDPRDPVINHFLKYRELFSDSSVINKNFKRDTIQKSCELPLGMLNKTQNEKLNDFDFVLFHLYQDHEDYRKYFLKLRKNKSTANRLMFLDNSAYEYFIKGESLDMEAFMGAVQQLKPDFYLLPDTLMNFDKTIQDIEIFLGDFKKEIMELISIGVLPMAVIQGDSVEEMLNCMVIYKEMGIRHICIPFHNSFFKDLSKKINWKEFENFNLSKDTEDNLYAKGRICFTRMYEHHLSGFEYVHLLGSHNPLEVHFHKPNIIHSIDTGYPVKLAVENPKVKLGEEKSKPHIIIDDFFDKKLTKKQMDRIVENITIFKNI